MQTDTNKNCVSVKLSDHYIKVGEQVVPLLSGQIDYWLHPALHWRKILSAVKDCSLPMVACYVPWNYHKLEDGTFDFVGLTDPQRNLAAFLDLASELGLYVFIRPGPWIYDHFMDGGIPIEASAYHRLDPRFLEMTQEYFSELCKILRPRLATNGGNIVICQPDNEIDPMPTLRGASGGTRLQGDPVGDTYFGQTIDGSSMDSSSWRSWLGRKYESIEVFNQNVGITFGTWDQLDVAYLISEKFQQVKRDILAYLEWYTTRYAAEISNMLKNEHIDIPLVLNTYSDMEPQNNCEFNQIVDFVGGDYWGRNLLPWRDVLLYSRHARHLRCATKTPWSAEYQSITSGELIDIEGVVTPQNATYLSLLAMLFGLKGWNWYVIAERSVLYFAPINNYGGILHEYYDRFKQMHDEFLTLDWPSYQSYPDGALWFYRSDFWEDVQYSQSPLIPFYTHSEYDAGSWMDWFERFHLMDFDIDLFDPHAEYNRIDPGTALVFAGHNRMDVAAQKRLIDLVNQGVNLIFLSTPPDFDLNRNATDLFKFLPQPTHIEGRNSNLTVHFRENTYNISSDYLALYNIESQLEERVFESIECLYGTCGYILQTSAGKIAVLGFQPTRHLLLKILENLGVVPAVQSGSEKVLTSAWYKESERVVIVLNTRDDYVTTKISINLKRLEIQPDQSYQVTFRLSDQHAQLSGQTLSELPISLKPKSGEIIHISPL